MSVNQGFDAGIREAEPMIVDDTPDTAGEVASPRLGADSLVWKFYGDNRGLLGFQRLAGTDRQEVDAILNGLRQAERSRQHATEAMQEHEARKTRERERGQDSGSDWG